MLCCCFLALGGLVSCQEDAVGPEPEPSGAYQVVYTAIGLSSDEDIFVVDENSSGQQQVTNGAGARFPAWSPDGNSICYTMRDNLYISNINDSSGHVLTSNAGVNWRPHWSSANEIAFESNRDGNWEIYVVQPDGGGLSNLTQDVHADFDARWTPDGGRLAFIRIINDVRALYTMNSDGSLLTRLSPDSLEVERYAWSPDGGRIALAAGQIYTVAATGAGLRQLTHDASEKHGVVWAVAEDRLAFTSGVDGVQAVYSLRTGGTDLLRLTGNDGDASAPSWSPDGRMILYQHASGIQPPNLYLMQADGSNPHKLTPNAVSVHERHHSWSPVRIN